MTDTPPSPSQAASRRWNETRRRITLFIPRELAEGVSGAELRAIAYRAIFTYLNVEGAALDEGDNEGGDDAP